MCSGGISAAAKNSRPPARPESAEAAIVTSITTSKHSEYVDEDA
jgi:hypothetical protein